MPVEAVIIMILKLRETIFFVLFIYINWFFDSLISQINFFDRLTTSRDFETKL